MKLLYCKHCGDILKLHYKTQPKRTCLCGRSFGYYVDNIAVHIFGPCFVLGMNNQEFQQGHPLPGDEWTIWRFSTTYPHITHESMSVQELMAFFNTDKKEQEKDYDRQSYGTPY